eukprot:gene8090-biopygen12108
MPGTTRGPRMGAGSVCRQVRVRPSEDACEWHGWHLRIANLQIILWASFRGGLCLPPGQADIGGLQLPPGCPELPQRWMGKDHPPQKIARALARV